MDISAHFCRQYLRAQVEKRYETMEKFTSLHESILIRKIHIVLSF